MLAYVKPSSVSIDPCPQMKAIEASVPVIRMQSWAVERPDVLEIGETLRPG